MHLHWQLTRLSAFAFAFLCVYSVRRPYREMIEGRPVRDVDKDGFGKFLRLRNRAAIFPRDGRDVSNDNGHLNDALHYRPANHRLAVGG